MMGRAAGIATAMGIALVGVTIPVISIIHDFFGSEVFASAWQGVREAARPRAEQTELKRARDFTFFTMEPVKGHGFEVTSGVRFKTVADLQAGHQQDRWCYVALRPRGGGAHRHINLAKQTGVSAPVFDDLSGYAEAELRDLGVSVSLLRGIARTHCRFFQTDGRSMSVGDNGAAVGREI